MSDVTAISGTRRAMKELVDGTVRVQIDIDPKHREDFFRLFGQIDMPVALAPLVADFEQREPPKEPIGPFCKLAVQWCQEPEFQHWLIVSFDAVGDPSEARAKDILCMVCGIGSRRELDTDGRAKRIFNEKIRQPYMQARGQA